MIDVKSFAEVLALRSERKNRSLLLGNGFSIACRPKIFRYDAIYDRFLTRLSERDSVRVSNVFATLGTKNFEEVIRILRAASAIGQTYQIESVALQAITADAELIRSALADAIAISHPERPDELTSDELSACGAFLNSFSRIYTLNYDLLMYWTLLDQGLQLHDGFHNPDDSDARYVEWKLGDETSADVFYLHGALHLFASGSRVRKLSWRRTRQTLKDQVLEQLKQGRFPLFVAEGTAEAKLDAINRHSFLSRAYRSFGSKGGDLFVFGASLGDGDGHIVDAIVTAPWASLNVGLHGNPDSDANRSMIARCEQIMARRLSSSRRKTRPFEVAYFDTASANVWGRNAA